jgi:hypothetical protein
VLGELVQTTAGKWITHPPTRCVNDAAPSSQPAGLACGFLGGAKGTRTPPLCVGVLRDVTVLAAYVRWPAHGSDHDLPLSGGVLADSNVFQPVRSGQVLAGAVDCYLKSSAYFPHPGIGQPAESIDEY